MRFFALAVPDRNWLRDLKGLLFVWTLAVLSLLSPSAEGQVPVAGQQRSYPSETYYMALSVYRDGDLKEAIQGFDMALSRSRKDRQGRWIDAIPSHAMLAECYYEAGNLRAAHEQLDQALRISQRFSGWIGSLQWPAAQDSTLRSNINRAPWWTGPPVVPAYTPNKVPISMTSQNVGAGPDGQLGVSTTTTGQAIDAVEILRALGMVYYRRQVLLGPLAIDEPLLRQSIDAIGNPSGSTGVTGGAVIRSVKAVAALTNGAGPNAAGSAAGAAMLPGGQVHAMTPILLCSAARNMAAGEHPESAYPLALRAAAAASMLEQPEWAAEAFEIAAGVKPAASAGELYQASISAAKVLARDSRLASVRIGSVAAESAMDAGLPAEAAEAFQTTLKMHSLRNLDLPRRMAYHQYVNARLNAAAGNLAASDSAIQSLVGFTARRGVSESTPRLYQLRLIESASRSAALGGKTAEALLEEYIRPPATSIWRQDPVDALGFIAGDRSVAMAGWVRAAAARNSAIDVLVRGDVQAQQQFSASLPLDGRVLQARWLAAAPDKALDENGTAIRKTPPAALARLRQINLAPMPGDPAALRQLSASAESAAYTAGLQRFKYPVAFPIPLLGESDLESMPAGEAVLAFIPAGPDLVGVLATKDKATVWPIAGSRVLPGQVARVMQAIGVVRRRGGSAQLPESEEDWKVLTASLRGRLVPDMKSLDGIERLVVVPTGALWYLPFELLPADREGSRILGDAVKIRYAPTPGLAVHRLPAVDSEAPVGIYADRFFAPSDVERNDELITDLLDSVEGAVNLPGETPMPGQWMGLMVRHGIVAAAVTPSVTPTPYTYSPWKFDQGMPGGQLADWLRFPWTPQQSMFLAGFRTGAPKAQASGGEELFFTSLAMHAAGVPELILSRWPVGGETTGLLLKEYAQEVPFSGVDSAWRRAVGLLRGAEFDPAAEPLLSSGDAERESLTGDQPLFWSGYMLFGGVGEPAAAKKP